jgi:hypothetical protein
MDQWGPITTRRWAAADGWQCWRQDSNATGRGEDANCRGQQCAVVVEGEGKASKCDDGLAWL